MAKPFQATSLRGVLSFLLVVVALGGGGLFYLNLNTVRDYAIEVNHRSSDADASVEQLEKLQQLKGQLAQSESLISKADQVFATPDTYQAQVLTDLKNYAAKTGLTIGSTDFSDPSAGGDYSVSVTFSQSVSYGQLIQFLHYVETNLPKLQVASLELSRTTSPSQDAVEVKNLNIKVSVR